jgi:hypothetical protein
MLLNELFNSARNRVLKWRYDEEHSNEVIASFETSDGKHAYSVAMDGNAEGQWWVSFAHMDPEDGEHSTDIVPVGDNAISVLATVYDIIKDVIRKKSVKMLVFSAKEPSRVKLYSRMAKRFNPNYEKKKIGMNMVFKVPVDGNTPAKNR